MPGKDATRVEISKRVIPLYKKDNKTEAGNYIASSHHHIKGDETCGVWSGICVLSESTIII